MFYLSEADYLEEKSYGKSPVTLFRNTLVDFDKSEILKTNLPHGKNTTTNPFTILMMISVSDSLGGISNITKAIVV